MTGQHQESWKEEMAVAVSQLKAFLYWVDATVKMALVQNIRFCCSVPHPYKTVKYSLAASNFECQWNDNQQNIRVLL